MKKAPELAARDRHNEADAHEEKVGRERALQQCLRQAMRERRARLGGYQACGIKSRRPISDTKPNESGGSPLRPQPATI
jgi:hypothetical protein